MRFKAPPGVFDIIPSDIKEPWKSSYLWQFVEDKIRAIAFEYGFQEIRTPLFEQTDLLSRGVGETSDIVTKEMYTFIDRGNRSMTLRPEGTAPCIRAALENQIQEQKLFYIAPMFRYERSQAGRYRQHHQFGVEVIGSKAPEVDAEVIDLLFTLYTRLGIKNLTVMINSIGSQACRDKYKEALKNYLESHFEVLSEDSKTRFHKNPLRILDSKNLKDQEIVKNAPQILDYLDEENRDHFEQVKKCLKALNIPFEVNPLLVRGLDYYNKTVFEIVSTSLGAQNSIGGGGRYDGLIKELGGPDTPSAGFGTGIERIIQTMLKEKTPLPSPPHSSLFLIPLGEAAKDACFILQKELRECHIAVEMEYSQKKLSKVLSEAAHKNVDYVAIIGDEELKTGAINLKEMKTGTSYPIQIQNLKRILQVENNASAYISLWKEMEKPFASPTETEFFIRKIKSSIAETSSLIQNLQNALSNL
jgi:histidyl-tRNA synthetase